MSAYGKLPSCWVALTAVVAVDAAVEGSTIGAFIVFLAKTEPQKPHQSSRNILATQTRGCPAFCAAFSERSLPNKSQPMTDACTFSQPLDLNCRFSSCMNSRA